MSRYLRYLRYLLDVVFRKRRLTGVVNPAASDGGGDSATPRPEVAEGDPWLDAFIHDFLVPIAADGRLGQKEETPLLAAYFAYGINERLAKGDGALKELLCETIRGASAQGEAAISRNGLPAAWQRIVNRANRITQGDFEKLRQWFREEAAKPRPEFSFGDAPVSTEFLPTALDTRTVIEFHKLFEEAFPRPAGAALAPDVPRPATAEGDGVFSIPFDEPGCDDLVHRVEIARLARDALTLADELERRLDAGTLLGQAFDECRRDDRNLQAVVVPPSRLADDASLWFVGDLHGDLLALEAALRYIDTYPASRPTQIVFLGDLFDDGIDGFGVLVRVLGLVRDRPGRVVVLAGNHDEALGHAGSAFCSSVSPSDFADWLNARRDDPLYERIGKLAIRFFESAPRALFLPDGLLVAHGGVPHSDQWDSLVNAEALNARQCLSDFVWTRAHEAPRKRPYRGIRGCEFGYEDFFEFCKRAARAIGQPVERMVRGHDHLADRYARYDRYDERLLTINAMSHRLPRELISEYPCVPCVARWVRGKLPDVHRLVVPVETISRVYPEPLAENTA